MKRNEERENAILEAQRAPFAAFAAAREAGWRDVMARAAGLRGVAEALSKAKDEIIAIASKETALTKLELAPEFRRMVGTLVQFAGVIEEGSWVRPTINVPEKNESNVIGPNHDVRSMLVPRRGAAVVFGASNFPLSYGVCGGDTASALAAGLGVVVKEHPAHPRTGRLIANVARDALAQAGHNKDVLGYVRESEETAGEDTFEVAHALILHESVAAIGFTGSTKAGLAIDALARTRGVPIPVFAEMGSTNPVFVTRAALAARGAAIANELGSALLVRVGQQCTCPGLILIDSLVEMPRFEEESDPLADQFEEALARVVRGTPAREMLSAKVREGFITQVNKVAGYVPEVKMIAIGAREEGLRHAPAMLLRTDYSELRSLRFLSEEAFGPSAVVARVDLRARSGGEESAVEELLETMQGQLVACVYAEAAELEEENSVARRLLARLVDTAGRVVVNEVPPGVRVSSAMVHGGPYPATNASETTAVGARALERWCRPVCYQNWPWGALPVELRGK